VLQEIIPTVGGHSPAGQRCRCPECQMASIQSDGYNPGEPATAIIMLLAISFPRTLF
jgi:hypothetical protein